MTGRIYILFLIAITMFSCRDKKQIPSDEVIGEIVRSAYAKDYFLEIFKKEDLPLNPNLVKLEIDFSGQIFAPSRNKLPYKDLLRIEVNGKKIFSKVDSAYFHFQNSALKSFELNKVQFADILYETKNPIMTHNTISIPIFSRDQKYAYVEIAHGGNGMGGGGFFVIVENFNGKWKVIKLITLWDS